MRNRYYTFALVLIMLFYVSSSYAVDFEKYQSEILGQDLKKSGKIEEPKELYRATNSNASSSGTTSSEGRVIDDLILIEKVARSQQKITAETSERTQLSAHTEEAEKPAKTPTEAEISKPILTTHEVSLETVDLNGFSKYMLDEFGVAVVFSKDLQSTPLRFSFKGTVSGPEELAKRVSSILDISYEKTTPTTYLFKKYITKMLFMSSEEEVTYTSQDSEIKSKDYASELARKIKEIFPDVSVTNLSSTSLLVRARPSKMRAIESAFSVLIKSRQPVCITLRLLELEDSSGLETSANWATLISTFGGRTVVGSADSINLNGSIFAVSTTRFWSLLGALKKDYKVRILREWSTLTDLGRPAVFKSYTEVPSGYETLLIKNEHDYKIDASRNVGSHIIVTPTQRSDGTLQASVIMHVSQALGIFKVADKERLVIAENDLNMKAPLEYGHTTLITGLTIDTTADFDQGWPFVKDIPGFGRLFKNSSGKSVNKKLVLAISLSKNRRIHSEVEYKDAIFN